MTEPPPLEVGDAAEERIPWRDALPPGIGHVRRARGRGAAKFFVASAAWLLVVVARAGAVARVFRLADADDAIAAAAIALLPLVLVLWARLDLRLTLHPATTV